MKPLTGPEFTDFEFALLAAGIIVPFLTVLTLKPGKKLGGWIGSFAAIVCQLIGVILMVPEARAPLTLLTFPILGSFGMDFARALGFTEYTDSGIEGAFNITWHILFAVGCGLYAVPGLYLLFQRVCLNWLRNRKVHGGNN